MLYNIPVNIVLHKPFDPNDGVTTHQVVLRAIYRDDNIYSYEDSNVTSVRKNL